MGGVRVVVMCSISTVVKVVRTGFSPPATISNFFFYFHAGKGWQYICSVDVAFLPSFYSPLLRLALSLHNILIQLPYLPYHQRLRADYL